MHSDANDSAKIPLPFVVGAISLLIALFHPGVISGGKAFLIGFLSTLVLAIVMAQIARHNRARRAERIVQVCPACGTSFVQKDADEIEVTREDEVRRTTSARERDRG